MNKAELARQLGVSRAYVTMLAKGKRQPSKRLSNRIKKFTIRYNSYEWGSGGRRFKSDHPDHTM